MKLTSSNKRLAKNTLFVYFRMLLILAVSLYTSRIILQVLGISDFGLYSLVNGIIISFTFVNTALISTAHRYLAYTLGGGKEEEYNRVFSGCTTLFLIAGLLLTIFLIPIGFWLIDEMLVIPSGRTNAAKVLMVAVGISFFLSFVKSSYNSVIITHERMAFYAYTGIAEAVLKLIIVYVIMTISRDKLVLYGILQALISLLFLVAYILYSKKRLCTSYSFTWDKKLYRELTSFSGWSLYDGVATIGKVEFVNFILNSFYGVVINAAVGVAKQVNSAVNSFTSNFQTAFEPQITKSYASGDYERLHFLINNTSKYSGVLFFMIAIPLCINIESILELWLGDVPDHTGVFVIFLILSSGLEALGGPFWMTGYAIGDIKWFQIVTGSLRLLPIPFVYLYIKDGGNVEYVFAALVISDLLIYIYRICYLQKKIGFDILRYLAHIFRLFLVVSIVMMIAILARKCVEYYAMQLVLSSILSIATFALLTYYLLMTHHERQSLKAYVCSWSKKL